MKTICFFNLKGGVAKTMSTANIAYLMQIRHEKNVLCIDADSQGNLSQYFDVNIEDDSTTTELLQGECYYCPDFVTETQFDGVDIIPADSKLINLDVAAIRNGGASSMAINRLRETIAEDNVSDLVYDYILIDCPPAFTSASTAALAAADEVIIPIRLDAFSTAGMADLMEQIRNMRKFNERLNLRGILVTQFLNTPEEQAALEWLRKESKLPIFDQVIRHSKRVGGSTFKREPLEIYSKTCGAAIDYRRLVADLVGGDDDGL